LVIVYSKEKFEIHCETITNKKSALTALFLLVMRREVIVASQIVFERCNNYEASARSEVAERNFMQREAYGARHQCER